MVARREIIHSAEPAGHRVGYARVSSRGQKLDSQEDLLTQAGCIKVFCDTISGVKEDRPGWNQLVTYLRPGDTLVITELSRMSRSLSHLLAVVANLEQRQVELMSLRENIDTKTATGRCFLSIMGAVAQMERELRAERSQAGREAARARGLTGGRPATDPRKLEQARILYEHGQQPVGEICQQLGFSRKTFYNYLNRFKHALPEDA